MRAEAREGLTGTERAGELGGRRRSRWGRGGIPRGGSATAAVRRPPADRRTAALPACPSPTAVFRVAAGGFWAN